MIIFYIHDLSKLKLNSMLSFKIVLMLLVVMVMMVLLVLLVVMVVLLVMVVMVVMVVLLVLLVLLVMVVWAEARSLVLLEKSTFKPNDEVMSFSTEDRKSSMPVLSLMEKSKTRFVRVNKVFFVGLGFVQNSFKVEFSSCKSFTKTNVDCHF